MPLTAQKRNHCNLRKKSKTNSEQMDKRKNTHEAMMLKLYTEQGRVVHVAKLPMKSSKNKTKSKKEISAIIKKRSGQEQPSDHRMDFMHSTSPTGYHQVRSCRAQKQKSMSTITQNKRGQRLSQTQKKMKNSYPHEHQKVQT
jgi:hypothetical protein